MLIYQVQASCQRQTGCNCGILIFCDNRSPALARGHSCNGRRFTYSVSMTLGRIGGMAFGRSVDCCEAVREKVSHIVFVCLTGHSTTKSTCFNTRWVCANNYPMLSMLWLHINWIFHELYSRVCCFVLLLFSLCFSTIFRCCAPDVF